MPHPDLSGKDPPTPILPHKDGWVHASDSPGMGWQPDQLVQVR